MLVMSYSEQLWRLVAKARRCGSSEPDAMPSGAEEAGGRRGGRVDGGAGDVTARSRRRALGVHVVTPLVVHLFPLRVVAVVNTTVVVLFVL